MFSRNIFLFLGPIVALFLFSIQPVFSIELANNLTKAAVKPTDPLLWDFGKVSEGEVLKHNFIFVNNSVKPLKIQSVNTSCGCTVSKVSKKELSSGENTDIEVSFNSKGYSGKVQQYIYLNTDNNDNPVTRFVITAEVVRKGDS